MVSASSAVIPASGGAMVLEAVTLHIRPGQSGEFERAFQKAQPIIASKAGYISHALHRSVEVKDRYLLLVRWNTIEDHTGLSQSPDLPVEAAAPASFLRIRPGLHRAKSPGPPAQRLAIGRHAWIFFRILRFRNRIAGCPHRPAKRLRRAPRQDGRFAVVRAVRAGSSGRGIEAEQRPRRQSNGAWRKRLVISRPNRRDRDKDRSFAGRQCRIDKVSVFFDAVVTVGASTEPEHNWMVEPADAVKRLSHKSHRWAVMRWGGKWEVGRCRRAPYSLLPTAYYSTLHSYALFFSATP